MFKRLNLTSYIFLGLFWDLLVITRMAIWKKPADFAEAMSLVTTIFLRLIKMIIAPLVFATLVVGIAKMGDEESWSRWGGKALGWFILAKHYFAHLRFDHGEFLPALVMLCALFYQVMLFQGSTSNLKPKRIRDAFGSFFHCRWDGEERIIFADRCFLIFFGTAAAAVEAQQTFDRYHVNQRCHHVESDCPVMNQRQSPVLLLFQGVVAKSGVAY